VGIALYLNGSLTPPELAIGLILSMGIVGPLMKFTVFVNDAKAMEYSIRDADRLLNLPELPDAPARVPLTGYDIELRDVFFSYDEEDIDVSARRQSPVAAGMLSPPCRASGGGKTTVAR
jgi:ATP-binding cassette subfamily B protein